MPTPCFWVDLTGEWAVGLRRYRSQVEGKPECPRAGGWKYHGHIVMLGRIPAEIDAEGRGQAVPVSRYVDDPRWPTHCSCGEPFRDTDERQVWTERIWCAIDGREWTDRQLPPGAMLDGPWHPQKGPDGLALVVVLPPDKGEDNRGNWWHVDGPSTVRDGDGKHRNGPAWARTGDPRAVPPTVSATPSIQSADYHGHLTNGVLTP